MSSEAAYTIPNLVDAMNEVTAAYNSSLPDLAASLSPDLSQLEIERRIVANAARELWAATQDPRQAVLQLGLQGPLLACIRTAITLGIFDMLPRNGEGITATELQARTGADIALIVRIMRAMTSSRVVFESGEERYAHTPTSLAFLSPVCGIFTHLFDEGLPTACKIPEYLATTGYKNPNEIDMTAFQYAFQTHHPFFEWLGIHPKQREAYIGGMNSSYRGGKSMGLAYPFDVELAGGSENDVTLVDLGGNAGQLLGQIKERFSQLPGRMIVQDRAETLNAAHPKPGIEYMPHDFFTPQPIIGAKAYHFRSIFHDWSDELCRKILQNLIPAMTPGHSKLLISDAVLPSVDAPLYWALMDIQMMGISGLERTEKQWRDLLEGEGLRIVKIWTSKANDEFVIEAVLPC